MLALGGRALPPVAPALRTAPPPVDDDDDDDDDDDEVDDVDDDVDAALFAATVDCAATSILNALCVTTSFVAVAVRRSNRIDRVNTLRKTKLFVAHRRTARRASTSRTALSSPLQTSVLIV
jgi:hypothetical protein